MCNNKISMDKKYRYRNGSAARILCTDRPTDGYFNVISIKENGDIFYHTSEGNFCSSKSKSDNDLIEVSPYDDFKIDDKVIVWNTNELKSKRHFAGINDEGQPLAWYEGKTSFTAEGRLYSWDHCEKYTGD